MLPRAARPLVGRRGYTRARTRLLPLALTFVAKRYSGPTVKVSTQYDWW